MSERDDRESIDPALLTGAYALNALDADEREQFEVHLDRSEELRTEVTGLSDTAVLLGLSSRPVTPSPDLKQTLMALLDDTPQLKPFGQVAAVPSLADQRTISTLAAAPTPVTTSHRSSSHRASGRASASRRSGDRWFGRRVGTLVAAAAAVALIVGGIGGVLIGSRADDAQRLTEARDLETSVTDVAGGGTATVFWSDDLARSAVRVDGLPALSGSEVYQLWYIDEAGATPAGTLSASTSGLQLLQGDRGSNDAVGVTVEPAPGATSPTSDPIFVVQA